MRLSTRLTKISEFVPASTRLIDIGADHGLLGIKLLQDLKIKSLIITDISEYALLSARENLIKYKIKAKTMVTDGLSDIDINSFETIVIAGMGADLMIKILHNLKSLSDKTIILSPHTKPELIRKFMVKNGFKVIEEDIVFENGKYYIIDKYIYDRQKYTKLELNFGPILMKNKNDLLKDCLSLDYQNTLKKYKQIPVKYLKNKIKHYLKLRLLKKALIRFN